MSAIGLGSRSGIGLWPCWRPRASPRVGVHVFDWAYNLSWHMATRKLSRVGIDLQPRRLLLLFDILLLLLLLLSQVVHVLAGDAVKWKWFSENIPAFVAKGKVRCAVRCFSCTWCSAPNVVTPPTRCWMAQPETVPRCSQSRSLFFWW